MKRHHPNPARQIESPGALPKAEAFARARELVLRFGWNATSYQVLNRGIDLWFSLAGDGVVGFVTHCGYRVVAGAPVCDAGRLTAMTAEFEADAARHGNRVCYFGAEQRLQSLFRDSAQRSMVLLGAQPVWDPAGWSAIVHSRPSLRGQLNRARNKKVAVEEWEPRRAENNRRLNECLWEWLATKGLPPLHFLVEPDTLGRLADRRMFVALHDRAIAGFLVATPVPARQGWLIEQIVRSRTAPNGTAELMLDAAVGAIETTGSRYVTLGLAPLSPRGAVTNGVNPIWLRMVLGWIRVHGRRFYNFEGLESFKAKFVPDRWDPIYAVTNERRFSPATLHAVAAAFGGGSTTLLLARALAKAVRTEAAWLAMGRGK